MTLCAENVWPPHSTVMLGGEAPCSEAKSDGADGVLAVVTMAADSLL
jgi:hypothetical protein